MVEIMPTITTMEVPRPTGWAEFETIVVDAMKLAWTTSRLQKNGRPGQAQDGVDIHGADDLERPVAIQCKRTVAAPSIKLIREEIVAAEGFVPQPITLYIATTADPDSTLQQAVRVLSLERTAQ